MIQWIVSSSVLLAALCLLRLVLRGHIRARLQYALWALALVRLLLPFSISESSLSVLSAAGRLSGRAQQTVQQAGGYEQQLPAQQTAVPAAGAAEAAAGTVRPDADAASPEAAAPEAAVQDGGATIVVTTPQAPEVSARQTDWGALARGVWLAGGLLMALWLLLQNLRFARALRRTRRALPVEARCPVYEAPGLLSPCLFGPLRPCIYLTPAAAADRQGLQHILMHETCHLLHGDHIFALLRCACLCVWWWNPLVWLAAALSRRDSELACDEAAIARLGEAQRLDYGRTLLRMVPVRRPDGSLIRAATSMSSGKRALAERVRALVKTPRHALLFGALALVLAAALIGCTFTGASSGARLRDAGELLQLEQLWTLSPGALAERLDPAAWEEDADGAYHGTLGEFPVQLLCSDGGTQALTSLQLLTRFPDGGYATEGDCADLGAWLAAARAALRDAGAELLRSDLEGETAQELGGQIAGALGAAADAQVQLRETWRLSGGQSAQLLLQADRDGAGVSGAARFGTALCVLTLSAEAPAEEALCGTVDELLALDFRNLTQEQFAARLDPACWIPCELDGARYYANSAEQVYLSIGCDGLGYVQRLLICSSYAGGGAAAAPEQDGGTLPAALRDVMQRCDDPIVPTAYWIVQQRARLDALGAQKRTDVAIGGDTAAELEDYLRGRVQVSGSERGQRSFNECTWTLPDGRQAGLSCTLFWEENEPLPEGQARAVQSAACVLSLTAGGAAQQTQLLGDLSGWLDLDFWSLSAGQLVSRLDPALWQTHSYTAPDQTHYVGTAFGHPVELLLTEDAQTGLLTAVSVNFVTYDSALEEAVRQNVAERTDWTDLSIAVPGTLEDSAAWVVQLREAFSAGGARLEQLTRIYGDTQQELLDLFRTSLSSLALSFGACTYQDLYWVYPDGHFARIAVSVTLHENDGGEVAPGVIRNGFSLYAPGYTTTTAAEPSSPLSTDGYGSLFSDFASDPFYSDQAATDWLNDPGNNGFLARSFSDLSQLSLHEVFYAGAGIGLELTPELEQAYRDAAGSAPQLDLTCIRLADADALLREKTGRGYDEFTPLDWVASGELRFFEHGDTNYARYQCLSRSVADGRVRIVYAYGYDWSDGGALGEVVLEHTDAGALRIVSNTRYDGF